MNLLLSLKMYYKKIYQILPQKQGFIQISLFPRSLSNKLEMDLLANISMCFVEIQRRIGCFYFKIAWQIEIRRAY